MPWTRRSRHQHCIRSGHDISLQRNQGRDISQWSRHHEQKREGRDISSTDEEVVTSLSCRDIRCKGFKVATSVSCRDINCEDLRSQHHSVVATSVIKNSGRDIRKLSQHQLQWKLRSRHQPVVTTSHTRKAGRDMIQLSRHQLQRMKGRDNSQRSRHPLLRPEGRDKELMSRHQRPTGPVNLKSKTRCIEIRAQLQNPINTQLLLKERSSWRLKKRNLGT